MACFTFDTCHCERGFSSPRSFCRSKFSPQVSLTDRPLGDYTSILYICTIHLYYTSMLYGQATRWLYIYTIHLYYTSVLYICTIHLCYTDRPPGDYTSVDGHDPTSFSFSASFQYFSFQKQSPPEKSWTKSAPTEKLRGLESSDVFSLETFLFPNGNRFNLGNLYYRTNFQEWYA